MYYCKYLATVGRIWRKRKEMEITVLRFCTFALSQKHCDDGMTRPCAQPTSAIRHLTLNIKTMIKYILKKCKNAKSAVFGKQFAYPVVEETLDLDALAKHMSQHNTPYSKGMIRGVLTDMVRCIKEVLLEGKNVKIDDLAIFSIGIKNAKGGAETEEDFNVTKNIKSVKLRARATGELTAKSLNLEATLKRATALTGGTTSPNGGGTTDSGNNGSTDSGNNGNTGGGGSNTGGDNNGGGTDPNVGGDDH